MQRIIGFVPGSKSKEKHLPDKGDSGGFYSEEERSAAKKRNQKARTFGDTDDQAPEGGKSVSKPSRFGAKGKGKQQVVDSKGLHFVHRPNIEQASEGQSATLYALQRRKTALQKHPFIHLMFSPQKRVSVFKKHLAMCYRGLTYSLKFLKGPSERYLKSKQIVLPGKSKEKALILDLDETLIHSCAIHEKPMFSVKTAEGDSIGINVRPHCVQFLETMSQLYDIHVFTAATIGYAQPIIDFLNGDKKLILNILPRTACMQTKNGFFIKDLRIISNYDLKDVIMIDNLVHSFGLQIENGVPIIEYHDDRKDEQLLHIQGYLREAACAPDIRQFNRSQLRLASMIDTDYETLIKNL